MTLLLALLGCSAELRPRDCSNPSTHLTDLTCPCLTQVYDMGNYYRAECRPDQTMRIEWEPSLTGARVENEDRIGALVVCECAP